MTSEPALKPCPFCQSDDVSAERVNGIGGSEARHAKAVVCRTCGAVGPRVIRSDHQTVEGAEGQAVRGWNRREKELVVHFDWKVGERADQPDSVERKAPTTTEHRRLADGAHLIEDDDSCAAALEPTPTKSNGKAPHKPPSGFLKKSIDEYVLKHGGALAILATNSGISAARLNEIRSGEALKLPEIDSLANVIPAIKKHKTELANEARGR